MSQLPSFHVQLIICSQDKEKLTLRMNYGEVKHA